MKCGDKNMFGYEYGLKPTIMIVGDIMFENYLRKANMYGLGYISIPNNVLENTPLEIALIFNDEENAKNAVGCFNNWIKASNGNGDALGLDIIEKKNGGYILCFYQDVDCLIDRTIPRHVQKWVNPLFYNIVYFKDISHVGENYYNFKNAVKFCKCNIYTGTKAHLIEDVDKIVKSKINIYTEDNIPDNSLVVSYMKIKSQKYAYKNDKGAYIKAQLNDLLKEREKSLKYFYPITYDKIIRQGFLRDYRDKLNKKFEDSAIIQAICNLTLYFRLEKQNKLDLLNDDYEINILEYLLDNHESMRSFYPDELYFTENKLIEQIDLDKAVKEKIGRN
ncbi:hypothetical protein [Clostridium lundense]|uniref:hypothetical protein n=1 Tax=Clostridium lundense TaxID=319475 RepID=UPI00146F9505|nr:hypothetical protein [Clostridium lundense]